MCCNPHDDGAVAPFVVRPVLYRGAVSYKTGLPEDWRGHSLSDFLNSPIANPVGVFFDRGTNVTANTRF